MTVKGNIRNLDNFISSMPEWDILDGCFGDTKIMPTDIDGCVERNGRCLFLEMKRPGTFVGRGQYLTFCTLVKQGSTVILFWATDGGNRVEEMLVMSPDGVKEKKSANLDDLRSEVLEWFRNANSSSSPHPPIPCPEPRRRFSAKPA